MNPSAIFVKRPVATILLMLALLLGGIEALTLLPISALPQIDYPTIEVTTFYPGASPDVMATAITAPLEKQLGQMQGLDQRSSTSSSGASIITLQFSQELALDVAEQEVQAAINGASGLLPKDLLAPPVYAKINPADAPVLTIAVTSKTWPLPKIEDIADTRLAQKISQIQGVGLVNLSGGQKNAMRIRVNPRAVFAYGLNLDDLRTVISSSTVNGPKGSIQSPTRTYSIDADDQLKNIADYKKIVVAYKDNAPVFLSDVADVVEAAENTMLAAWANRQPAIILNIHRQPDANVIAVVDRIKAMLPRLKETLPASVDIAILTDRTATIRASIREVEMDLVLAAFLVGLVIFLFLQSPRASLIPCLSVPLSLIGTFGAMYFLGFTLNNLTLMAFTIATGFVVDDAIVMIENISRYIEDGLSPFDAALAGSKQITFTIISLTLSLIGVFIPLLFMGGVAGRLFREFAITLTVAITISALVSMTLVPMLCSKLLRSGHPLELPPSSLLERSLEFVKAKYARLLDFVLARQAAAIGATVLTCVFTGYLYLVIPKGFFPTQDTGILIGVSSAPGWVSFKDMAARQEQLAQFILQDPDVESLTSFIGIDGVNTTLNSGHFLINLKPQDQRRSSAMDIARRITARAESVIGISLYLQAAQDLAIDASTGRTQYQFVLEDTEETNFETTVPKLIDELRQDEHLRDVSSVFEAHGLGAYLDIDRETAARFGITLATIDNALYDAFGQRRVATVFSQANQKSVVLETDLVELDSIESLMHLYLPSSTAAGGQVPLATIASLKVKESPLRLDRYGPFPAVSISFNLAPGTSLGEAVDAIRQKEQKIGLPAGMLTHFQGAALALDSALRDELLLVLAAIIAVYIILGILYESFIHPITILSTLPSASVGALLALLLMRMNLDIIGVIGIVLLIGIVKKNAIMMIDFALAAERQEGMPPQAAIRNACLLRLRPILMTTFAALFGALPLMFGSGPGAELRTPLGVSIIGGLIVSQVLTLFTTPVIYLGFKRLEQVFRPDVQLERSPAGAEHRE
jgi:multidrug efflux pump